MKELYFWKDWNYSEKFLYWIGLSILFLSILIYLVAYIEGINWVLGWEIEQITEAVSHSIDIYSLSIFELPVESADFITIQQFIPKIFDLKTWTYGLYQAQVSLAFILILGILSGAKRLPYTVIMAVFGIYWANANLDLLGVWQSDVDVLLLLVILFYFPLHYYFHAFNKNVSAIWRTLIFLVLTCILNIIFFNQSQVTFPYSYIVNYAAWIPIILSLIFITMVSHDMIWLFFQISFRSQPVDSPKKTRPFVIISLLYIIALGGLYLKDINWIWIDIYYLDIPWIFTLSTIVGIWGFRKRSVWIEQFITFRPFAAFLYLTLSIITFATLAHYHFTANDAINDLLRDVMLYSHIAFGIIFFVQMMVNVTPILHLAKPIHEVIYEKIFFPGNWARGLGFLLLAVLFYQGIRVKVNQAQAGYLIGLGDTYLLHQDIDFAQKFYLRAANIDSRNFRGQYLLGNIFEAKENYDAALLFTEKSAQRSAYPFIYHKISQIHLKMGNERYALQSFQEGLRNFPNSLELKNNIALLYAQLNELDSAQSQFASLLQESQYQNITAANIKALQTKLLQEDSELIFMSDSSSSYAQEFQEDLIFQSNQLAFLTQLDSISTDSLRFLDPSQEDISDEFIIYLYNYAQNQKRSRQVDSLLLQTLQKIRLDSNNIVFSENLTFAEAIYQYYQGNVKEGTTLLSGIPEMEINSFYNRLMGLWLMQLGAYDNSVEYFSKAIQQYDGESILYRAIAYSEVGDFVNARNEWRRLSQIPEAYDLKLQVGRVLRVLGDEIVLDDDEDRLNYIHYKKEELSDETLEKIYSEMSDSDLKLFAGLEIINRYLTNTKPAQAQSLWEQLPTVKPTERLASEKGYTLLRLLIVQKEYKKVLEIIDDIILEFPLSLKKDYIRAIALDKIGKKEEAEKYYLLAEKSSLFDPDASLAIAAFYSEYRKNHQKAYEVLATALQRYPNSIPLLKAYTLQTLNLRVFYYGEEALERLKGLIPTEEYESFVAFYQQREEEIQAKILEEE